MKGKKMSEFGSGFNLPPGVYEKDLPGWGEPNLEAIADDAYDILNRTCKDLEGLACELDDEGLLSGFNEDQLDNAITALHELTNSIYDITER